MSSSKIHIGQTTLPSSDSSPHINNNNSLEPLAKLVSNEIFGLSQFSLFFYLFAVIYIFFYLFTFILLYFAIDKYELYILKF